MPKTQPRFVRSLGGLLAALAAGAALPAAAEELWRGDFSTGDLSQWTKSQSMGPDRLRVVDDPVDGSRKVLRVLVQDGDDPINASGFRNELVHTGDDIGENSERYYRWQTLWPEDYPGDPAWQIFTQWHHYDSGGSPPIEFTVWGEELSVAVRRPGAAATKYAIAPLERGRWHDFLFHVNWSSDPTQGFVELWYDGGLVLPKTSMATLFPNDGVYLKHGLYRKDTVHPDQVLFHTGMTVGTALEDVLSPAPDDVPPPGPKQGPVDAPSDELPPRTLAEESGTAGLSRSGGCSTSGSVATALGPLVALVAFRRRRKR